MISARKRARFVRWAALGWLFLFVALPGCDSSERKIREASELRQRKRAILDELYREYGGSGLANRVRDGVDAQSRRTGNESIQQFGKTLAGLVGSADQSFFEQQVLSLGNGERPLTATDQGAEFFARQDVREKAVEVARLDLRVRQLEKELGVSGSGGGP